MKQIFVLLTLFVANIYAQCQWSEWAIPLGGRCNDTYGMCGVEIHSRTCLPAECICEGEAEHKMPCGDRFCIYTRYSCSNGYKRAIIDGAFQYVPTLPGEVDKMLAKIRLYSARSRQHPNPILPIGHHH